MFTVQGFSFAGTGQNAGMGFVTAQGLVRAPARRAEVDAVAGRAWGPFSQIQDALVFPIAPPPVTELGTSTGFDFYLKDEAGRATRR